MCSGYIPFLILFRRQRVDSSKIRLFTTVVGSTRGTTMWRRGEKNPPTAFFCRRSPAIRDGSRLPFLSVAFIVAMLVGRPFASSSRQQRRECGWRRSALHCLRSPISSRSPFFPYGRSPWVFRALRSHPRKRRHRLLREAAGLVVRLYRDFGNAHSTLQTDHAGAADSGSGQRGGRGFDRGTGTTGGQGGV